MIFTWWENLSIFLKLFFYFPTFLVDLVHETELGWQMVLIFLFHPFNLIQTDFPQNDSR